MTYNFNNAVLKLNFNSHFNLRSYSDLFWWTQKSAKNLKFKKIICLQFWSVHIHSIMYTIEWNVKNVQMCVKYLLIFYSWLTDSSVTMVKNNRHGEKLVENKDKISPNFFQKVYWLYLLSVKTSY